MVEWHSDLKLSPIVVLEGQNITLECTCSEHDECLEKTARSYWRFQDNDVARTARVRLSHVITEKTLRILMVIRNVSRLDNGSYLCGISTSKGFDEVITRLHVVPKGNNSDVESTKYIFLYTFLRLIYERRHEQKSRGTASSPLLEILQQRPKLEVQPF